MSTGPTTRRVLVRGRVQGVGYRAALVEEARRLDLTGWVRNRPDGTVEALATGPAEAVDALVAWAHRGPRLAAVDAVDAEPADPHGTTGFTVAR